MCAKGIRVASLTLLGSYHYAVDLLDREPPGLGSDPSRTAEAYGHLSALHYDRDIPSTSAYLQHIFHSLGISYDIYVFYLITLFGEVLTGRLGVGSGILAIDKDLLGHGKNLLSLWSICLRYYNNWPSKTIHF